MIKKIALALGILVILGIVGFVVKDFLFLDEQVNKENSFLSPLRDKLEDTDKIVFDSDLANEDEMHVLLLGIDRRSKAESAFRTDIMIMVSINKKTNQVVLTSVPRDLWYGGGRINALYIQQGFEGMQDAFETITGKRPTRYVLTDFEDFSWIVDAFGGVPVDVEITFTDSSYPVDATHGYQTVTFVKGPEVMDGDRALIFARSRKGDFDNGDWGRMRRQHLLLQGMLEAAVQPGSFVCELTGKSISSGETCEQHVNKDVVAKALKTVTTGKMETNLQVNDLVYLWDFYKDKDLYNIDSLLMDYDYLFTPPAAEYGGAWVLAPINGSYYDFKKVVEEKLLGTPAESVEVTPEEVEEL